MGPKGRVSHLNDVPVVSEVPAAHRSFADFVGGGCTPAIAPAEPPVPSPFKPLPHSPFAAREGKVRSTCARAGYGRCFALWAVRSTHPTTHPRPRLRPKTFPRRAENVV
jgi:hypothetical protein